MKKEDDGSCPIQCKTCTAINTNSEETGRFLCFSMKLWECSEPYFTFIDKNIPYSNTAAQISYLCGNVSRFSESGDTNPVDHLQQETPKRVSVNIFRESSHINSSKKF